MFPSVTCTTEQFTLIQFAYQSLPGPMSGDGNGNFDDLCFTITVMEMQVFSGGTANTSCAKIILGLVSSLNEISVLAFGGIQLVSCKWYTREDSNLQPTGFESAASTVGLRVHGSSRPTSNIGHLTPYATGD